MASNLSKRLDRLERLANELLTQQEGPVYCKEGEAEGNAIVVRREYVAAPERPALTLPPSQPSPANLFGADKRKPNFSRPLEYPKVSVV
jgi:hypothetical protein